MKSTENHKEPKLNLEGLSEADLKRNAFETPEDYFENLTPRVMESVRNSEQIQEPSVINWKAVFAPVVGIAAVALMVWFFIDPNDTTSPDFDTVLASLSVEELNEYADFDATDLVSFGLVDFEQITLTDDSFTNEEIFEYLSEEELELNTLIEEIEI